MCAAQAFCSEKFVTICPFSLPGQALMIRRTFASRLLKRQTKCLCPREDALQHCLSFAFETSRTAAAFVFIIASDKLQPALDPIISKSASQSWINQQRTTDWPTWLLKPSGSGWVFPAGQRVLCVPCYLGGHIIHLIYSDEWTSSPMCSGRFHTVSQPYVTRLQIIQKWRRIWTFSNSSFEMSCVCTEVQREIRGAGLR